MSGAWAQVTPTCPHAPPYKATRVDRFSNYQKGYLLEGVGPQLATRWRRSDVRTVTCVRQVGGSESGGVARPESGNAFF